MIADDLRIGDMRGSPSTLPNATPGSCTTTEPSETRSAPKWDAVLPPRKPAPPRTRSAPAQQLTTRRTPCSNPSKMHLCLTHTVLSPTAATRRRAISGWRWGSGVSASGVLETVDSENGSLIRMRSTTSAGRDRDVYRGSHPCSKLRRQILLNSRVLPDSPLTFPYGTRSNGQISCIY